MPNSFGPAGHRSFATRRLDAAGGMLGAFFRECDRRGLSDAGVRSGNNHELSVESFPFHETSASRLRAERFQRKSTGLASTFMRNST
jgi:hypothetical protein